MLRFRYDKDKTFHGNENGIIILLYEMVVNLYEMTLLSGQNIFHLTTNREYSYIYKYANPTKVRTALNIIELL